MHIRSLSTSLAALVWLLNPAWVVGCGGEESFSFGESDMVALMQSINDETWLSPTASGRYEMVFELRQSTMAHHTQSSSRGIVAHVFACSNREFVASADACMDRSVLGLEGQVVIRSPENSESLELQVNGTMEVIGRHLTQARVRLSHPGGEFYLRSEDGTSFSLEEARW